MPPKQATGVVAKRPAACLLGNPTDDDSDDERLRVAAVVIDVEASARSWKCEACCRSDVSAHPANNGACCCFCFSWWRPCETSPVTRSCPASRGTLPSCCSSGRLKS
eukprot:11210381-Alexandrium_andersonii.AAC.1